ncbi:MAG TPA: ATP-binding cassette domain-containing protein [Dactylosporangium sp.]|jgi:ABC-2 type transport system ATP-binding protein|nr:ATP-binding cassette domain-containing protein [Dactylosporangium sp.]
MTAVITEPAIEVEGLVKTFAGTRALDGLDLRVAPGTVYGFLGPNGAGKTTTVRILAGLLRPDAGTARVFGHDVVRQAREVRRRVGLTGQFASVDDDLTGLENLKLIGRLVGYRPPVARERADELLAAFGLSDAAGRLVKGYSGGMRRRLDIAASLVSVPELMFLDEPTTGLDPRSRNQVWDIVRALAAAGTTVVLTTQQLDEADRLADRVALIDHGRVVAEGTLGELKASLGSGSVRVRLADPGRQADAERVLTRALGAPLRAEGEPGLLSAAVFDVERASAALRELGRAGIAVTEFTLGQPTLDEVFLALTGSAPAGDEPQEEVQEG